MLCKDVFCIVYQCIQGQNVTEIVLLDCISTNAKVSDRPSKAASICKEYKAENWVWTLA